MSFVWRLKSFKNTWKLCTIKLFGDSFKLNVFKNHAVMASTSVSIGFNCEINVTYRYSRYSPNMLLCKAIFIPWCRVCGAECFFLLYIGQHIYDSYKLNFYLLVLLSKVKTNILLFSQLPSTLILKSLGKSVTVDLLDSLMIQFLSILKPLQIRSLWVRYFLKLYSLNFMSLFHRLASKIIFFPWCCWYLKRFCLHSWQLSWHIQVKVCSGKQLSCFHVYV